MDINETLNRSAHGENRLDPSQQKQYLGTFRERVCLTLALPFANQEQFVAPIRQAIMDQKTLYSPLVLKLSAKLSLSQQTTFLRLAQELSIPATIVDESNSQSPYGLVLHSDHALNIEDIDWQPQEKEPTTSSTSTNSNQKKSFWQKIFG